MEALREFLLAHGGEVIEESNRETFNTLAGEAAKEDALGVLALLQKRSAPAQGSNKGSHGNIEKNALLLEAQQLQPEI